MAAGLATCVSLALVLLRFLSASLLVEMGNACGGIFAFGHGFLATSHWNYLLAAGLAAVFLLQLTFLLGGGARLLRASYRLGKKHLLAGTRCPALPRITGKSWAGHVYLTSATTVEAHTSGLIRSRIHISQAMVRRLPGDELMAVIYHERAHCSGKDNFLAAAAKTVSLAMFYLPGPRMAYQEMRIYLEKAADRTAAAQTGGPLVIARALARIATAGQIFSKEVPAMPASGHGDVTSRLQVLANDYRENGSGWKRLCLFILLAAAALAFFSVSALVVTGADQRQAFICYMKHQQGGAGVCKLRAYFDRRILLRPAAKTIGGVLGAKSPRRTAAGTTAGFLLLHPCPWSFRSASQRITYRNRL